MVNGKIITNPNFLIKQNDIICFNFNSDYLRPLVTAFLDLFFKAKLAKRKLYVEQYGYISARYPIISFFKLPKLKI